MSRIRLDHAPQPPFWAVVFPTRLGGDDDAGYVERVARMLAMAPLQQGYLGCERVPGGDGVDSVVAFWDGLESIGRWKMAYEKREADRPSRSRWDSPLPMRIAKIETADEWSRRRRRRAA